MTNSAPARVLVVCTGNVCRSPLVARLLQSRLDAWAPGQVVVTSAGTRAVVGQPMTRYAAAELTGVGGSPDGHVARQLTEEMLAEADLVLTATLAHRADVVTMLPRATRRTFALRELARLVDLVPEDELTGEPADRVRALPAAAGARRGFLPPVPVGSEDVTDPIGGSPADYRRTTDQILPAVDAVVRVLKG